MSVKKKRKYKQGTPLRFLSQLLILYNARHLSHFCFPQKKAIVCDYVVRIFIGPLCNPIPPFIHRDTSANGPRPSAVTTVSPSTLSFIAPYFTVIVPEERVDVAAAAARPHRPLSLDLARRRGFPRKKSRLNGWDEIQSAT